ncbi:MAG: LysM peptidoglycan-binding domain-containing protein [Anaerolineales bacterium]|nr:LysM peptidoglycan-binding domain-containing protein [Anaerolineales bacterium]
MPSRSIRISFIALIFILVLGLVACVRPVPGQEAPPTATPAVAQPEQPTQPEGGEGEVVVPEQPIEPTTEPAPVQPEGEGGEETGTETEQPVAPEGESPRPEDGTGEGEVIVEEGNSTVDDATQGGEAQPEDPNAGQPEAIQPPGPEMITPPTGQRPEQPVVHIVQPGENLYRIGLMYGYSWVVLQQYNGLANPNFIVVGQEIRIPGTSGTGGVAPDPIPPSGTYVVQAGDTLFSIGRRFGVDHRLIAEANGIVNPNLIFVGQVLKIPAPATPLPATGSADPQAGIGGAGEITHVVQAGETLFGIALRYGVAWPVIVQTNNLELPYALYEGQTLVISTGG